MMNKQTTSNILFKNFQQQGLLRQQASFFGRPMHSFPAARNVRQEPKCYEFRTTATFGDTNTLGNMYFLNFFRLQGVVREMWVKDCVSNGLVDLENGLTLITRDASCEYRQDFVLYDEILVRFYASHIANTYANVKFQFIHNGTQELHAEGAQKIVFADASHQVTDIPVNWREAIVQYLN